jgi:hypothetical protein
MVIKQRISMALAGILTASGLQAAPTDETLPYSQTYCVTAESGLNVRANPMIREGNVIASLPFQTEVTHRGPRMNVDWQSVNLPNGQWGYVHVDHLRPCGP